MNQEKIRELLAQVQNQTISIDEAIQTLKLLPYEDMGFATIDHHRAIRQGISEVVYCQHKDTNEIIEIIKRLRQHDHPVLATRALPEAFEILKQHFPEGRFYQKSRAITIGFDPEQKGIGNVMVICAGTSDLPMAEEAIVTARFTGSNVTQLTDVGVAGIHRLLGRVEMIRAANAIVVVAGMEGALASVVGGLVDAPVIAVPTSVGYGASFGGVSALLTMLNSCSAGVSVVNIDNGFGAGYAASLINKKICLASEVKQ